MSSTAVATKPSLLNHPIHKHGLVLQELSNNCDYECSLCYASVKGCQAYHCSGCEFFLHKSCAEMPQSINHPFHPEHRMVLMTQSNRRSQCRGCDVIRDDIPRDELYHYYCSHCRVGLHVWCAAATLPAYNPDHPEKEDKHGKDDDHIQHFSHKHPLESFHMDTPYPIVCDFCRQQIKGRFYGCRACLYLIHESCTLMARQLTDHPLHPQHTLTLVVDFGGTTECNSCWSRFHRFVYKCSECCFALDLKCAVPVEHQSVPTDDEMNSEKDRRVINHFSHPHPLTYHRAKEDLTNSICDLCYDKITDGDFYFCRETDCRFMLHRSCGDLPQEIIHSLHPEHPLIYEDSIDDCFLCHHCFTKGFRCKECRFSLSPACAALEALSLSIDEVTLDIPHLHKHPMRLYRILSSKRFGSCGICWEDIKGLAYLCEYRFCDELVFHKTCANLPRESQHSVHPQHPLYLLPKPSDASIPCSSCLGSCSRITFHCDCCKVQFHLLCAMKNPTLKNQRHEHSLTYFGTIHGNNVQCSVCFDDCRVDMYRCVPCNYNLHYACLFLPSSVKHEWHIHPMVLLDRLVDDFYDEQYCDLCETVRHPEHGVYYCNECRCATHIDCVIPMKAGVKKRRQMNEAKLMKLDKQISSAEAEIEAMEAKVETARKNLEELKETRKEMSSRMQAEAELGWG